MREGITIIVCGGRNFSNQRLLNQTLSDLDEERSISTVYQGGARGADMLALSWARANGKRRFSVYADWKKHGKSAGPIRNQEMLELAKPDLVVAFPGGRGTADMINRALRAGIETIDVRANQHTG